MSQQIQIVETTLVTRQGVLKALNVTIRERQQYHNEQEQIINDLIESGNTRLMELNHDIQLAKKERNDLKADHRSLMQEKIQLKRDIELMKKEADGLFNGGMANAYA